MPFPASDRVVYERNPLEQVICQLRFPSILKIASQEPSEFQDLVREKYPLYEHTPSGPDLPEQFRDVVSKLGVDFGGEGKHEFRSENEEQTIALTKDFLALTDSAYKRWEQFVNEMNATKSAFETVYGPAFYSRVGLRFCDFIDREELDLGQVPWANLLRDVLLGFLHDEGVRSRITETHTQLAIRLDEPHGSLMAIRHGLGKRSETGSDGYVIDIDCFISGKVSANEVTPALESFHRVSGNFFRWVLRSTLSDALRPTLLEGG